MAVPGTELAGNLVQCWFQDIQLAVSCITSNMFFASTFHRWGSHQPWLQAACLSHPVPESLQWVPFRSRILSHHGAPRPSASQPSALAPVCVLSVHGAVGLSFDPALSFLCSLCTFLFYCCVFGTGNINYCFITIAVRWTPLQYPW